MSRVPQAGFQTGDGSPIGPYMLTLCSLTAPVSVRFREGSPLSQFKFFMSREDDENGTEILRLHMGYFASLAEAERWAGALRHRYPDAVAQAVPLSAPESKPLTDTQVLRILDGSSEPQAQEQHAGISLVGPEDTSSRRALNEAVAHGAPVSFAVQLLWSVTDIDLRTVPSLSIFRLYTLYKVSTTREGRSWHCLRLGFFKDANSAKQVAYYVRPHFASVAVVPVIDSEQVDADWYRIDTSELSPSPPETSPRAPEPAAAKPIARTPPKKQGKDSLEQTLEMLAESEMWNDPDSHSETGVRHLKFEIRKASSG